LTCYTTRFATHKNPCGSCMNHHVDSCVHVCMYTHSVHSTSRKCVRTQHDSPHTKRVAHNNTHDSCIHVCIYAQSVHGTSTHTRTRSHTHSHESACIHNTIRYTQEGIHTRRAIAHTAIRHEHFLDVLCTLCIYMHTRIHTRRAIFLHTSKKCLYTHVNKMSVYTSRQSVYLGYANIFLT